MRLLALFLIPAAACAVGAGSPPMVPASEGEKVDDLGTMAPAAVDAWVLPPVIRALGESYSGQYTGAGVFDGGVACAGDLLVGTRSLLEALDARFADIRYAGYACVPNDADPSVASMYATGRVLTIEVTMVGGQTDHARGDGIANYLVSNAGELGVQLVVWNQTKWNVSYTGRKDAPFRGRRETRGEVYVELTPEGATRGGAPGSDPADDGVIEGTEPGPEPEPEPEPLPEPRCTDTCEFFDDFLCDDGGPGASTDFCPLGTDCFDCGPR